MYHYCPTSSFLSIVESKTIWLSDFKATNDNMEGRWADHLFSIPDDLPYKDKISAALSIERHFAFRSPTYVACFSLKQDLLSQWRGYADNGQGVAIGVRADFIPSRPPLEIGVPYNDYELNAVDVVYDEEAQRSHLEQLVNWYTQGCQSRSEGESEGLIQSLLFWLDHLRASMKSPGFSEEHERRIIFKPQGFKFEDKRLWKGTKNPSEPRVRAAPDRLVEYFACALPKDAIKEVVLGPKNRSDDEAVTVLLRSSEFQNVKVSRSAVSYA